MHTISATQHPTLDRFKNNGQNFLIQLQTSRNEGQDAPGATASAIVVPEDLVQIQSYLRWERNGKRSYTADQEKASSMINLHLTLKGTSQTDFFCHLSLGGV